MSRTISCPDNRLDDARFIFHITHEPDDAGVLRRRTNVAVTLPAEQSDGTEIMQTHEDRLSTAVKAGAITPDERTTMIDIFKKLAVWARGEMKLDPII